MKHADIPGLRFDKIATRVIARLQSTLRDTVPDGVTVAVTITAPIRVPAKTAAALEEGIGTLVGRMSGTSRLPDFLRSESRPRPASPSGHDVIATAMKMLAMRCSCGVALTGKLERERYASL